VLYQFSTGNFFCYENFSVTTPSLLKVAVISHAAHYTTLVTMQCSMMKPSNLNVVSGRRYARASLRRSPLKVQAAKVSVGDLSRADLEGKRVLVRSDLNVPMDKATGAITDDTRIRAACPTLKYLSDNGAKILLTSHLVGLCVGWESLGGR